MWPLLLCALLCPVLALSPWPLSEGVHTLLDGALLGPLSGCSLEPGAVHKDPRPLIVREHPWEATLGFYSSLAFLPASLSPSGLAQWHWYYTCAWSDLFTDPPSFCVAVSTDAGATWSKPLLPYYPWTGGANGTLPPTPTNIVFRTQSNTFSGSVLVDSRAATPRQEAIQLGFEASVQGQAIRMPYAARSSDGLRFESWEAAVARGPLLPQATFADTNLALAAAYGSAGSSSAVLMAGRTDSATGGSQVQHGQAYCADSNPPHRAPLGTLLQCSSSSSSGCNISSPGAWPPPHQLLALGYPDDDQCLDVYNFPAVSLGPDAAFNGRASWVSLPSSIRHLPQAQSGAPTSRASGNDGFMDVRLAVSRNALNWSTPATSAFLPRGVGVRDPSGLFNGSGSDPDAGFVYVANGGVLDPDAALAVEGSPAPLAAAPPPSPWLHILYWGGQTTHAGGGAFWYELPGAFTGLLRARVRREGWMALSSPRTDTGLGWATTLPLLLPLNSTSSGSGSMLVMRLNAEVDASGNLTVQLQDAGTMLPLPGYAHEDCLPLRGNGLRQELVWGANRSTWLGGSPALPAAAGSAGLVLNFSMVHAKVFAWELAWV